MRKSSRFGAQHGIAMFKVVEIRRRNIRDFSRIGSFLLLQVEMIVKYSVRMVQAGMPMTVNVRRDPHRPGACEGFEF